MSSTTETLTRDISVDRLIALGPGLAPVPERLLLAHARGEVLFIAGAGISEPAGLPNFRKLALEVCGLLDRVVHDVLVRYADATADDWRVALRALKPQQAAEANRFRQGDYDVVLGMLERRMDSGADESSVRKAVSRILGTGGKPARIHRALMRLSDRGGASAIVTTNFDHLLELAAQRIGKRVSTHALGGLPRPGRQKSFAGVMHIHGALDHDDSRVSDLVLTDRDFGEFYLRRRVVPDFIYDAARLYYLVLVGYSANDAPMRYLLNAVAADGIRFSDLKERFAFTGNGAPDPVSIEDWKGRGITPIPYDDKNDHEALLHTLEAWAAYSANNGKRNHVDAEIRRAVRSPWNDAPQNDRDLFEHLVRRSNSVERLRIAGLASAQKADLGWLDAIRRITAEAGRAA